MPSFPAKIFAIAGKLLVIAAAAFVGALVGLYIIVAVVVARARAGSFLFSFEELLAFRPETVIVAVAIIAAAYVAYRRPRHAFRAWVRGIAAAFVFGLVGALVGHLIWGSTETTWSAAIIVSAVALVVAIIVGLLTVSTPRLTRTDLGLGALIFAGIALGGAIGLRPPADIDLPTVEPEPLPPIWEVDQAVFLVGDAGATESDRSPLLDALALDIERWSRALRRDSAVSVVFLGDLVYPVGIRDSDHELFPQDSSRLWNQIDLVGGPHARRYATPGVFIPGNHDWGNRGDELGITRIHNLSDQLDIARQRGYAAILAPPAGLSGPVARDIRENVRLMVIDTHWFLRTRSRQMRETFLTSITEAIEDADDRHVIVASHHPYSSAGPHGVLVPGMHNWGIDVLLAKSGALVQDLNSAVYEELLEGMRESFEAAGRPPLVFAGGHDHSLQVLEGQHESDPACILVSGSGSKISGIQGRPGMHYGASRPGYMLLLFGKDGSVRLYVIAGDPDRLRCTEAVPEPLPSCMVAGANGFEITYGRRLAEAPDKPLKLGPADDAAAQPPADQPATVANVIAPKAAEPPPTSYATAWWTASVLPPDASVAEGEEEVKTPPVAVPTRVLYFAPDSVVTTTGATYPAGPIKRVAMGRLNRHLWDEPVRLPLLNLDAIGGGVVVDEITGGMQTFGLKLDAENGITYQFRSIVKDATRGLPNELAEAAAGPVINDQLAAQFPLSAMIVADLLQAVNVLVAPPRPVVMPNDDRLGDYRPYIAGRVGWIEERPNEGEGDGPGFAGSRKVVGGPEVFVEMREDPTAYINIESFLNARMVDFIVSDWDRHTDNYRWARFDEGERRRWEVIPRDRDWALCRSGGAVSALAAVVFPNLICLSEEKPPMDRLARSGYRVDHLALARAERSDYIDAARRVQARLSDDRLRSAIGVLPPEYHRIEADALFETLRTRRDMLEELANEFYELVSRTVDVYGLDDVDEEITLTEIPDGTVLLSVQRDDEDAPGQSYERVLDPAVTTAVRLYIDEGDDEVRRPEGLPLNVFVQEPGTENEVPREY